ncbi:MAG: hypothetical protein KF857_12105 [Fimbriimonadaceae bacterium]|nr:hypothetical protein [Fimbriimonadaceae bacterium]
MDQINRIVQVNLNQAAHTYGVDRDRKERPSQGRDEPKESHHDVVEIHEEVLDIEPQEDSSEHHDVDISA